MPVFTDAAREAARLADQARLNTPTRRPKEPTLSPSDTRMLSGVSPEVRAPNITSAAIRVLGNAPATDLTKRELFAAVILTGLIMASQGTAEAEAIRRADLLIAALDASRLD